MTKMEEELDLNSVKKSLKVLNQDPLGCCLCVCALAWVCPATCNSQYTIITSLFLNKAFANHHHPYLLVIRIG